MGAAGSPPALSPVTAPSASAASRAVSRRLPVSARLVQALLVVLTAAGTLLAFRWPTPIGNMTVDRALAILLAVAVLIGVLPYLKLPSGSHAALGWSLAMIGVTILGLLYTPAFTTGKAIAGNVVAGVMLFFVTLLLAFGVLRRFAGNAAVLRGIARAPLWGFLPSGFVAMHQAYQLLRGTRPTIPLISLSRLTEASLNSARTAFGSGLNEFNLDRVAAATGDPPTFGMASAIVVAYALWARGSGFVPPDRFYKATVALAVGCVVISVSVSAILVLSLAVLVHLPKSARAWLRSFRGFCAAAGTVGLLLVLVPAISGFILSAHDKITTFVIGSASTRVHVQLLSDAWGGFVASPLWGLGTGGLAYRQYGVDPGYSSVHNAPLLSLAEQGVIGLIVIVGLFLSLRRAAPSGLLACVIMAWILYLDFNRLPALWVILAIAAALRATTKAPPARQPVPALAASSARQG